MWGKNDRDFKPVGAPPPQGQQPHAPQPHAPAPERPQAPAPAAPHVHAPAAAAAPAGTAALGRNTRLKGEVYSEEDLFLDGEVEGILEVRGRLTIGANGKVKASVKAKEVIVKGSVQGDVEATDRIAIMNGASIVGDVKTAGIVIEDGAYFKGGIDILRPEVKKADHAPSESPKPSHQGQSESQKPKVQMANAR